MKIDEARHVSFFSRGKGYLKALEMTWPSEFRTTRISAPPPAASLELTQREGPINSALISAHVCLWPCATSHGLSRVAPAPSCTEMTSPPSFPIRSFVGFFLAAVRSDLSAPSPHGHAP